MTTENIETFRDEIIQRFYIAMHDLVHDNFNAGRFNHDGIDRSEQFLCAEHTFFLIWFFVNQNAIFNAYLLLNDAGSKSLYKDLLIYRLAGHLHYRIPSAIHRNEARYSQYLEIAIPYKSIFPISGVCGELVHYDFEWEGERYVIDCIANGLGTTLAHGQYFFSRNNIKIAPSKGDHVIDGGACLGDTALTFSNAVGATGKVYSFDPVEDNLLVCFENEPGFFYRNVTIFPTGLSNKNIDANPIRLNCYAPGFSSAYAESINQEIPLRSIDFLIASGEIERVDFIKLDVEGSEMDALTGAQDCIDKFKPKMAISIYHKPDDFFELINYIKKRHPFYAFHLDHYSIHREETVLYCVAP